MRGEGGVPKLVKLWRGPLLCGEIIFGEKQETCLTEPLTGGGKRFGVPGQYMCPQEVLKKKERMGRTGKDDFTIVTPQEKEKVQLP